jgi:lipid-binding SYLF domain-containing protein
MIRPLLIASLAATLTFAQEKWPDSRLRNATNALREIMDSPDKGIPEELIEKAQCIVVVPDLLKAAFFVGGKYGRGYASCRNNGRWSAPAAVRIEGGSFGLQLGGSSTDLVMLVMNKKGMERLLADKVTIGGEIAGAAGPVGRHISAQTDVAMHAEILTWSRSRGLFGGISLDGATLRPDSGENKKLYGRETSQRETLEGQVPPPPAAREFVALLNRISRPGEFTTTENPKRTEPAKSASTPPASESLKEPSGRVTLGEKQVHFATAQYAIPSDAEPVLNDVAKAMKDNPNWTIRIEGNTDNTGSKQFNQKLSQQRAEAVMNWLAEHGVDTSRMTAKGYGESRSVADNSTEEGRAKNRRVEIVRTDNRSTTGE